ncbi:group 3 secretory phospholipase A2 [Rhineura floridana]|uniref:group 3 secretory phospholipase A2 n=1 Tax=Rhineura floridana TaxID=261503 RepID=UPI002AC811AD|nr:group 3 secretory phospholipase A2 [Rhineura floridana]
MALLRSLLASQVVAAAMALAPGTGASWRKANTFCHMIAPEGGRVQLLSFLWLRPDGLPPALVQSAWDSRGRLLGCAWRAELSLTGWYLELCAPPPPPRPGSRRRRGVAGAHRSPLVRAFWGPELRRWLGVLEAQKDVCRGPASGEAAAGTLGALEERGRKRVRRGWTVPGTLWCGAGDSAGNFTDLGVFQGPDVCCREHDRCEAQISALGYGFGMRNFRLHTVSHCDCDAQFRHCLMNLNDTISNFIGVTFFNLLEAPCFVLEESEECLEWHWWGGCKAYGLMPLARLVEQSHYYAIVPSVESSHAAMPPPRPGQHRSKGRKHSRKKNRKHPGQGTSELPRLPPEHSEGWASVAPPVPVSERDLITPSLLPRNPEAVSISKGAVPLPPTLGTMSELDLLRSGGSLTTEHPAVQRTGVIGTGPPSEAGQRGEPLSDTSKHRHTAVSGNRVPSQSCSCYRRLDQCPYRIAPNEVKYQLHNLDSRTLFHCNCTRRLARFLRRTKGPNEVEGEVLFDYVSSACFVLQTPPGCLEGEEEQPNCVDVGRALLAPARHLTNRLARKYAGTSLKVKRQERSPLGQPVQLFDKCKQLARDAYQPRPH